VLTVVVVLIPSREQAYYLGDTPRGEGSCAEPVGAENLVHGPDQQSCSVCLPAVMVAGHVPAIRLSPDHACGFLAAVVSAR